MGRDDGQTWLPVPAWEDLYEVSGHGLVWGVARRGSRGGIMKTPPDNHGYLQVNLCRDGKVTHTLVHILVLAAFAGPPEDGQESRHLDGNRANNRWAPGETAEEVIAAGGNLIYGSSGENNLDQVRHGTHYSKYRNAPECVNSHDFTPENTGHWPDGRRYCIACRKRRNKEQAARRKTARKAVYDARLAARP